MVVPVYIYLDLLSLSVPQTNCRQNSREASRGFTDEFTVDGVRRGYAPCVGKGGG